MSVLAGGQQNAEDDVDRAPSLPFPVVLHEGVAQAGYTASWVHRVWEACRAIDARMVAPRLVHLRLGYGRGQAYLHEGIIEVFIHPPRPTWNAMVLAHEFRHIAQVALRGTAYAASRAGHREAQRFARRVVASLAWRQGARGG